MKVRELMHTDVASVHPDECLNRATELMHDRDCGCIVVVDDERKVTGILTDRDVCMAALRTDSALSELTVRSAMNADVCCCVAQDSIDHAEQLMGQHQVRRLPVIDEARRIQGILSLDDIAAEAWREQSLVSPRISTKDVGRTLGEIGRPGLVEMARS